ncbi:MAG: hypothetical protein AAGJ18_21470, partial [Bacteroidota bacterium]
EFQSLQRQFFQQPVFDFEFLEAANGGNIEIVKKQLLNFQNDLGAWRIKNQLTTQESVKHLNSKTAIKDLTPTAAINTLEEEFASFLAVLNRSELFVQSFKDNAMTLQLKQQLLDDIIERLNKSIFSLRDFATFFDWRRLKTNFSTREHKVMQALIKVQPKDWKAAFDAWYFHHLLTKQNRQNSYIEPLATTYLDHYAAVQRIVPNYVQELWETRRLSTISTTKKRGKSTYTSFLKKSADVAQYAKYFQIHLERITNFYPILLMTAETAKTLLHGGNKVKFDQLIIKDGAALTKEQGGSLLNLAYQVAVFDELCEQNANLSNTFSNLAQTLAGKQVTLKTTHRTTANPILAFNNAAFDEQLNVDLGETVDVDCLIIRAVDGDYDRERRTNEVECRQLLSLLTDIKGTPQQTYPKVGFLCATVEQRNLLSTYLLKIKQKQANGSQKINHLERNGLRVLSFEELSGERFDHLFISLTYGVIDSFGNMAKEIDFFNTTEGIITLQKVLNSGTKSITVCHSFPTPFIQANRQTTATSGLRILANFLHYGELLRKNNRKAMVDTLDQLKRNKAFAKISTTSLFMEEVAHHLAAYFEPDRIMKNQSIQGKVYPLVIAGETADSTKYILQADQQFNKGGVFSYVWQRQLADRLATEGYQFLTIWSKNWWRQPTEAARKLAGRIIRGERVRK